MPVISTLAHGDTQAQMTLPVISTLALGACMSFYNYYGTLYVKMDAPTFVGRASQVILYVGESEGEGEGEG